MYPCIRRWVVVRHVVRGEGWVVEGERELEGWDMLLVLMGMG